MAESKKDKTLEMRVAELEDKMSAMNITEEEMAAFNKVASLMGGPAAAAPAAGNPAGLTPVPGNCIVANCIISQCTIRQCTVISACTVISQCTIRQCTVINPCTIISQCINQCINECGGGLPAPVGGGGFGSLGS